ncbi:MAG: hypothetical protein GSR82_00320, partial [Desulfurococcales archaeon]|nr:hypothetical protein [Desulfurococcales archaeon]
MRMNRRKLLILTFGIFLLAIIIGELAVFFFMGSRGRTQGFTGGMECEWNPVSLNRTVFPEYPNITVSYSLKQASNLGDFFLEVRFANNGHSTFNLDKVMGGLPSGNGDMVIVVFDRYGFIDSKPLAVRSDSKILGAGRYSRVLFKIHFNINDPVYSMLVFPKAGVRMSSWIIDPHSLKGVCNRVVEDFNGVKLVERWATLVEGLTVFEAYLDTQGKMVTLEAFGDSNTTYKATIYDNRGVIVQAMTSPSLPRSKFSIKGFVVLGASAGQIRGEPYTIDVFNSLKINGVEAKGYKRPYTSKPWPETIPGRWVTGQYKIDLDNGLVFKFEFAYNGYILVIRSGELVNPTKENKTFNVLLDCSPTKAYPIPA